MQPGFHGGGLVGAVVVADEVNVQVGGDFLVDLGEELLEFGGAVPSVQALGRSQPAFPMMPGMPEKRTHDYVLSLIHI